MIQTYPQPPRGFDFDKLSDISRASLGLPRLPAAVSALNSRIDEIARSYDFIKPKFSTYAGRSPKSLRFRAKHASEKQDIWAGGITFPAAGDTMNWVEGNWKVPSVSLPTGAAAGTRYAVSSWVGLDGDDGSPDVLQAGCDAYVTMVGGVPHYQYCPWFEWAPADPQNIDTMPVSVDDTLHCIIRLAAGSKNSATILFCNQTKNLASNFTVTAPPGYALFGNCAEWIVESNASLGPIPQYQAVTFTDCNAGTAGGATIEVGSGRSINMTGGNQQVISYGAIVDATTVQVIQA